MVASFYVVAIAISSIFFCKVLFQSQYFILFFFHFDNKNVCFLTPEHDDLPIISNVRRNTFEIEIVFLF